MAPSARRFRSRRKRRATSSASTFRPRTGALEKGLTESCRVEVPGIYFDFNQATLNPLSRSALSDIAGLLTRQSDWRIAIEGHTDNVGTDAYNQDLSTRRAAAVKTALVGGLQGAGQPPDHRRLWRKPAARNERLDCRTRPQSPGGAGPGVRQVILARSATARGDDDDADGARDALTSRCETFEGDGRRDRRHHAQVHHADDQKDRRQAGAAAAAVEAEAQTVPPGRAGVGRQRMSAPGASRQHAR